MEECIRTEQQSVCAGWPGINRLTELHCLNKAASGGKKTPYIPSANPFQIEDTCLFPHLKAIPPKLGIGFGFKASMTSAWIDFGIRRRHRLNQSPIAVLAALQLRRRPFPAGRRGADVSSSLVSLRRLLQLGI
jgi:hypothetical protein